MRDRIGWNGSVIPVWTRLWIFRFSLRAKSFPQPGNGHGNGFSPAHINSNNNVHRSIIKLNVHCTGLR